MQQRIVRICSILLLLWTYGISFLAYSGHVEQIIAGIILIATLAYAGSEWRKIDMSAFPIGRTIAYAIGFAILLHTSRFVWLSTHESEVWWIAIYLFAILLWTMDIIRYERSTAIFAYAASIIGICSVLIWGLFVPSTVLFFGVVTPLHVGIIGGTCIAVVSAFAYKRLFQTDEFAMVLTGIIVIASVLFSVLLFSIIPLFSGIIAATWWYFIVSSMWDIETSTVRRAMTAVLITAAALLSGPWM